jgi:hypothetical protein
MGITPVKHQKEATTEGLKKIFILLGFLRKTSHKKYFCMNFQEIMAEKIGLLSTKKCLAQEEGCILNLR